MPAEAKLSLPGCALASAISSAMLLAGTLLATTSISGTVTLSVIGAISLTTSYGTFSMKGLMTSALALTIPMV